MLLLDRLSIWINPSKLNIKENLPVWPYWPSCSHLLCVMWVIEAFSLNKTTKQYTVCMSYCFAVFLFPPAMTIMNEKINTKRSTLRVIIKHTQSKLQCFVLIALLNFQHSKCVVMHILKLCVRRCIFMTPAVIILWNWVIRWFLKYISV